MKLLVSVFVREILPYDGFDKNFMELQGYLCKKPHYRKTPLGREIADLMFAVNRTYGKTDYIPCISWGRTARRVNCLPVGTYAYANGRLQSREYIKKHEDGTTENKVSYEFSIGKFEENEVEYNEE